MDFYFSALISGIVLSLMALGIYISMKIFKIPDITTDGSYTLGAVITALLLTHHWSFIAIIPAVIAAGATAGALTGLIHTKLKIDALLAGILGMTALYSINLSLLGRSNLPLFDTISMFNFFSAGNIGIDLMEAIIFITLFYCIIGYMLKTDFGIAMRATGSSESMSKAMGVNVNRMKITGLAIANALTALSGYLMCQYQNFTDISMGIGIVIVGLGSVLIGDTLARRLKITRRWMRLVFVICGSILFQLVLAFALTIGIDPVLLKLLTASFVLLIVGLPNIVIQRKNTKGKSKNLK